MPTASRSALAWPRRMLGHLLTAVLAGLGGLASLLGAGLAMIGLCCGAPALTAATAGASAGATAAAVDGPAVWPFFTAAAVLLTAAWLQHRRTARRGCPASPERPAARAPAAHAAQADDPRPIRQAE